MFLVLLFTVPFFGNLACTVVLKNPDPITYVKLEETVTLSWIYNLSDVHDGKFDEILLFRFLPPSGGTETLGSNSGIPLSFRDKVSFASPGSFTLRNITEDDLKYSYLVELRFVGPPAFRSSNVRIALRVDVQINIRGDGSLVFEEGETMQLVCDVTGVPQPDVRWYNKTFSGVGHPLVQQQHLVGSFNYTATARAGTYICQANNTFNTSVSEVEVRLKYFMSKGSISVCDTDFLCCPAFGVPIPLYRWILPDGKISPVTEQCLPVKGDETGGYSCEAQNVMGTATVSVEYCSKGNVSTVNDSRVYKGKAPLAWSEYENVLFYSIYGTSMNKADGIPPYVWSGRQNETEVHWGSFDNFPEGKPVNMKFDVIAYSKTSSQLFYRQYIFLESSVARNLQNRYLTVVAVLVFGFIYLSW